MKFNSLFGSLLDFKRDDSPPRNRIVFWVSILLAALFLYLALRNLEWNVFFSTLHNIQIAYLPLFLMWGSLAYVIRSYRWKVLLSSEKQINSSSVFFANMAGYLGNAILPARTGELVRAAYIAKKEEIHTSFALATGLTERLMDVIALVVLGSLSLSFAGAMSSVLKTSLNIMGLVGVVSLIGIILLPRFANLIKSAVDRLSVLNMEQKEELYSLAENFLVGLASLLNIRRAASFIGLTGMVWLADAAGTVFVSHTLTLSLTFPQAFILLAALGLSSAIPSTPGYVGVYQFVTVLVLTPFGFSEAQAVAFILFSQIMNLIVVGTWGMIAVGQLGRTSNTT